MGAAVVEGTTFGQSQVRATANALGLIRHSVLPSLGVQGGLSIVTYGIARATNRVDLKDWLWPSGMVLNAWWTAVGRHTLLAPHVSPVQALRNLGFAQQALLGGVTAWGSRLAHHIISRSSKRGEDDARYQGVKTAPRFWNKASLLFGLEAVFQTLVSLPFTSAFRGDTLSFSGASREWAGIARWMAAGLFTAGLALESIADWQLASHKKREAVKKEQGGSGEVLKCGVWSIVRHPTYLGDTLCHFAFPLWTYGTGLFSYWQVLGPVANYLFLRWIGGDRENEASMAERYRKTDRDKHAQLELYQLQKHSFWPSIFELANPWAWIIAGIGATGAALEYVGESRIASAIASVHPVDPKIGEELARLA